MELSLDNLITPMSFFYFLYSVIKFITDTQNNEVEY